MFIKTLRITLLLSFLTPVNSYAQKGDAVKGKRVWTKCRACHTLDEGGKNRIGPNLYGVINKAAGTVDGFKYSKPMAASGILWTNENMRKFLKSPRKFMKGTKMSFAGIRKDEQINDLMAYIAEKTGEN